MVAILLLLYAPLAAAQAVAAMATVANHLLAMMGKCEHVGCANSICQLEKRLEDEAWVKENGPDGLAMGDKAKEEAMEICQATECATQIRECAPDANQMEFLRNLEDMYSTDPSGLSVNEAALREYMMQVWKENDNDAYTLHVAAMTNITKLKTIFERINNEEELTSEEKAFWREQISTGGLPPTPKPTPMNPKAWKDPEWKDPAKDPDWVGNPARKIDDRQKQMLNAIRSMQKDLEASSAGIIASAESDKAVATRVLYRWKEKVQPVWPKFIKTLPKVERNAKRAGSAALNEWRTGFEKNLAKLGAAGRKNQEGISAGTTIFDKAWKEVNEKYTKALDTYRKGADKLFNIESGDFMVWRDKIQGNVNAKLKKRVQDIQDFTAKLTARRQKFIQDHTIQVEQAEKKAEDTAAKLRTLVDDVNQVSYSLGKNEKAVKRQLRTFKAEAAEKSADAMGQAEDGAAKTGRAASKVLRAMKRAAKKLIKASAKPIEAQILAMAKAVLTEQQRLVGMQEDAEAKLQDKKGDYSEAAAAQDATLRRDLAIVGKQAREIDERQAAAAVALQDRVTEANETIAATGSVAPYDGQMALDLQKQQLAKTKDVNRMRAAWDEASRIGTDRFVNDAEAAITTDEQKFATAEKGLVKTTDEGVAQTGRENARMLKTQSGLEGTLEADSAAVENGRRAINDKQHEALQLAQALGSGVSADVGRGRRESEKEMGQMRLDVTADIRDFGAGVNAAVTGAEDQARQAVGGFKAAATEEGEVAAKDLAQTQGLLGGIQSQAADIQSQAGEATQLKGALGGLQQESDALQQSATEGIAGEMARLEETKSAGAEDVRRAGGSIQASGQASLAGEEQKFAKREKSFGQAVDNTLEGVEKVFERTRGGTAAEELAMGQSLGALNQRYSASAVTVGETQSNVDQKAAGAKMEISKQEAEAKDHAVEAKALMAEEARAGQGVVVYGEGRFADAGQKMGAAADAGFADAVGTSATWLQKQMDVKPDRESAQATEELARSHAEMASLVKKARAKEEGNAAAFLKQLGSLHRSSNDLLGSVKEGSSAEERVLDTKGRMLSQLMGSTLQGASQATLDALKAGLAKTDAEMAKVRATMSGDEKEKRLAELARESQLAVAALLEKDGAFEAEIKEGAFKADLRRAAELDALAAGEEDAVRNAADADKGGARARAESDREMSAVLQSVMAADMKARSAGVDADKAFKHLAAREQARDKEVGKMMRSVFSPLDKTIRAAESDSRIAEGSAESLEKRAAGSIFRANGILGSLTEEEQAAAAALTLQLQKEGAAAKQDLEAVSSRRLEIMRKLGLMVDEARDLGRGVFAARRAAAERMNTSLDEFSRQITLQGGADLAASVRSVLSLEERLAATLTELRAGAHGAAAEEGALNVSAAATQVALTRLRGSLATEAAAAQDESARAGAVLDGQLRGLQSTGQRAVALLDAGLAKQEAALADFSAQSAAPSDGADTASWDDNDAAAEKMFSSIQEHQQRVNGRMAELAAAAKAARGSYDLDLQAVRGLMGRERQVHDKTSALEVKVHHLLK